jgi:hypothetical protein
MTERQKMVLVCLLSGTFGAVATTALQKSRASVRGNVDERPGPAIFRDRSFPSSAPTTTTAVAELNALRRRLDSLERAQTTSPGRGAAPAPPSEQPRPTPEESRRFHTERTNAMLERFRGESVDAVWSERSSRSVRAALSANRERLGVNRFSVECRSTMCVAEVEWPSHSDAQRYYADVAVLRMSEMNCATSIGLLEPPGEGLYRARLILDCEEDRTGAN